MTEHTVDNDAPQRANHPPVVHGADFIRSLFGAWDCCGTCAGGVLARHDREVRARALRDAADQLDRDGMKRLSANTVKQWLRARADA
jgi:hypothetical protein